MSPRRKRTPLPGEELTDRQQFLLTLIVRDHVATAQPVGSSRLVKRYHLNISPATVRNEMAVLTEKGYLTQPHTSAGRVPTPKGYRFFVEQLLERSDLPPETQRTIAHQFYQAQEDIDQWMQLAASVLAQQARAASLVTAPHPEEARYKHLELIGIRGRQVLLVLVLVGGEVRQRLLHLTEPLPQARLSAAAEHLNARYAGQTLEAIRSAPRPSDALEADIRRVVVDEMEETAQHLVEAVYRDGLVHVLAEPEFNHPETARRALAMLENRALLERLLQRVASQADIGSVQVLVGSEDWEELRHCSLVLARYGAPGLATGMVGVLGPTRMAYSNAIPTVRFVARLLSDMVTETLAE
ncbi:MAG TPA: heat-inducible transcription repressor HrcA [Chloroflexi bacterium]|nr:heat-inducible transcription repressor HrcA [Chloroflexota bacterium]